METVLKLIVDVMNAANFFFTLLVILTGFVSMTSSHMFRKWKMMIQLSE